MGHDNRGKGMLLHSLQSTYNDPLLQMPSRNPAVPEYSELSGSTSMVQPNGIQEYVYQDPYAMIGSRIVTLRVHDISGSGDGPDSCPPFPKDAQAIVSIISVSEFDQRLSGESSWNSLADSLKQFELMCRNPQLADIPIVLFFTETDILHQKIQSGVRVSQ